MHTRKMTMVSCAKRVWLSIDPLLNILSHQAFCTVHFFSKLMVTQRFVPMFGWFLKKYLFIVRGEVATSACWARWAWKAGALNIFDCYGAHAFQHLKKDVKIRALVAELQPDPTLVLNACRYFLRPQPIGIALRLLQGHL